MKTVPFPFDCTHRSDLIIVKLQNRQGKTSSQEAVTTETDAGLTETTPNRFDA